MAETTARRAARRRRKYRLAFLPLERTIAGRPYLRVDEVAERAGGAALYGAGIPAEDLLGVERVLGLGMARYAEAFRVAFAQAFLQPGDSEADLARRYADAAELMRPLAGTHPAHVFPLHLRQLVRSVLATQNVRETVGDDRLGWSYAGEKILKGFAALVRAFRARQRASP